MSSENEYYVVLISCLTLLLLFGAFYVLASTADSKHWEANGPTVYADEVEPSLPRIMRAKGTILRIFDEVKFHHRWLGVILSHNNTQPRVFRLLVLWSRLLMVAFLLAVIYRNADLVGENSCRDYLTEDTCAEDSAFLGAGSKKCKWKEYHDNVESVEGVCVYIESEDSVGRIVFLALFVAIVSVPWSILVDYLALTVLASGHETVNKVVSLTGLMDDLDEVMKNDLKGTQSSSKAYTVNRFGRKEMAKKTISYSATEGFEFTNKHLDLNFECQQEYNSIIAEILSEDNAALSKVWGLKTTDGEYLMKKNLKQCRLDALKERFFFNSSRISIIEKSRRLLYLFIRDIVSTNKMYSSILDAKYEREYRRPMLEVSETVKTWAWAFICLSNVAIFSSILGMSFDITNARQNAWIITLSTWVFLDAFVLGFAQVIWIDVFIPLLVRDDVYFVKEEVRQSREAILSSDNAILPTNQFDMSKHFFVSNRIVQYFPFLKDADVVLNFHSMWPKLFYEKHESMFMPFHHRGLVYNLLLQFLGGITSTVPYAHDFYIWIISPFLLIGAIVVLLYEAFHIKFMPRVSPYVCDNEGSAVSNGVVKSYVIPVKVGNDKEDVGEESKVFAEDLVRKFDDSEVEATDKREFLPESDHVEKTSRDSMVHPHQASVVAFKHKGSRNPVINNESTEISKEPCEDPVHMSPPLEKMKPRDDCSSVPRLPESVQHHGKLKSKLSRIPSELPEITTDLSCTRPWYSSDLPMNLSASVSAEEPVLKDKECPMNERDYMETPTRKKTLRPVVVKTLPTFDVTPPVSRHGARIVKDFSVLTPDKLERATRVKEKIPDVTVDDTFVDMPRFEDHFKMQSLRSIHGSMSSISLKGRDDDIDEEEADRRWIDEGPDENYKFDDFSDGSDFESKV